ncbi:BRO-N domain-containing protein [Stutzerimonas nitrititolerans]|uniref:BRO-N domain-containing protein n=1 Tax=Stutzerimonas nitrititolerans TaxID=2482751 RepID=UPI0028B107C3|nr:BRO family protein [Stutzerimonas nitrititolerans]
MSLPMEFSFDGAAVRVVLVEGEPWWVAVDVCSSIGLADTNKALLGLDDDEKREHEQYSGSGRKPILINESGLYSLILRSRKAEAKRFKKWVTAEVLPSIRKHGAYVMPAAEPEQDNVPMAAHVAADEIVSAGRVFRALYTTGRSMGMARRLAATRANQAAERATGVDLAAELGATRWLDGPDLPEPQRKQYELQQQIRAHLVANGWPQGFSSQQLIEALVLVNDKATQTAVGHCLGLLGYKRTRLGTAGRPYAYVLSTLPATA